MSKRVIVALLMLAMVFSMAGCQSKEAKTADEMIAAIGTVTLESGEAIEAARHAYDSLSKEDKDSLKNAELLFEAEDSLLILQVIDAIDRLPHINLNHKDRLDEILEMYERIPAKRQAEVTNYDKLRKGFDTWYQIAYNVAEGLLEENDLEGAMEYYRQLPDGYEETDARIAEIQPRIQRAKARRALFKTWKWDGEYAMASDGNRYPADFQAFTFAEDDRDYSTYSIYGNVYSTKFVTNPVENGLLSESAITKYYPGCVEQLDSDNATNVDFSTASLYDEDGNIIPIEQMETVSIPDDEYAVLIAGPYMRLSSNYKLKNSCRIEFHFQKDGRLRVEYLLRDLTSGTERRATMAFYYTAA